MPEKKPIKHPPREQPQRPGREHQMTPKPKTLPREASAGKLEGKVALITGGDSGIGRAVAVLFAHEGSDVTIVYLNEAPCYLFLASSDSSYMTGQVLHPNGGEVVNG